jgi:hypothetical protein
VAAEYLAGESGILIIIGYAIAAAWLLPRLLTRPSQRVARVAVTAPRAAQ